MTVADTSTEDLLDRLEASAVDGRAHNIRYRQNQIHLLHAYLRKNAEAFCLAISKDEEINLDEAELEYFLTMTTVKEIYEQLDFEQSLAKEYAATKLENNTTRRAPYGIVLVRPGTYTRLYSIIAPLAAAIGAGNCVLFEMPLTLRNIDGLIREGLKSLDRDAYNFSAQKITTESFLAKCMIVDEFQVSKGPSTYHTVVETPKLSIAIVDRTANVEEAAKAITTARTAFRGRSPQAPDIVLVNEFVKQDFVQASVRCMTKTTATLASKPSARSCEDFLKPNYTAEQYDMIFASNKVQLIEIQRKQQISPKKIILPTIVMLSVTGLVDALTIASKVEPFITSYCFGDVKSAKFLSQHLQSKATFINKIPAHWLVGPGFPNGVSNLDPNCRYDLEMFSVPRPEQVVMANQSSEIASKFLYGETRDKENLRQRATKPLQPTGQASGSSMGFFDQGIITGLIAFVLPSLGLVGFSMYKIVRLGCSYYRS